MKYELVDLVVHWMVVCLNLGRHKLSFLFCKNYFLYEWGIRNPSRHGPLEGLSEGLRAGLWKSKGDRCWL